MVPFKEVQGQSLFLAIPNKKGGIKLEMLIWRVIVRYLRKPEKFRIQSNLQVYRKALKIMNRTTI